MLTLFLALQIATCTTPTAKTTDPKSSRKNHGGVEAAQKNQWWLWATLAVGAAGAIGGLAILTARRVKQNYEQVPSDELENLAEERKCEDRTTIANLSLFQFVMRHKYILLAKGAAGIAFRSIDLSLDVIAGAKFQIAGDKWWAAICFAIILLSPWFQYAYIKLRRGWAAEAIAYLIPGSFAHLQKEIVQLRFISKLPQSALFANVHKVVSTGTFNEILAGIECTFESLPQALLQLRAYAVKGGDWVNQLSIAFSLLGVAVGAFFALQGILSRTAKEGKSEHDDLIFLTHGDGQTADLQGCNLDDLVIRALLWLASNDSYLRVWNFTMCESVVDDSFLGQFAELCPDCTKIYLRYCNRITNIGVQDLARGCRYLTLVDLMECEQVGDDGVKELAQQCPNLEHAILESCKGVTDEAVKEIANHCHNLKVISLFGTKVTDAGVKEIATHCRQLNLIRLTRTRVTDQGVQELANHCRNLTSIYLQDTEVTDAGVQEIATHCRQLQKIDLTATGVTDHGVQELKKNCPNLQYLYDARGNNRA